MSVAIGDNASITLPSGTKFKADSYGYTNDLRLVNTTGFEDGDWDTFEVGGRSAGLVVSGHPKYDETSSNPDIGITSTASASWTITVAPGCTIVAMFKKYRAAFSADKKTSQSRITVLAQQTGAATILWDETAGA